ncbi:MAG: hypothetical protein IJ781_13525, partial [Atopobiaceae bacterium]|nr:hypothetical protein [Atopobiaceae bacterium]
SLDSRKQAVLSPKCRFSVYQYPWVLKDDSVLVVGYGSAVAFMPALLRIRAQECEEAEAGNWQGVSLLQG